MLGGQGPRGSSSSGQHLMAASSSASSSTQESPASSRGRTEQDVPKDIEILPAEISSRVLPETRDIRAIEESRDRDRQILEVQLSNRVLAESIERERLEQEQYRRKDSTTLFLHSPYDDFTSRKFSNASEIYYRWAMNIEATAQ